MIDSALPAAWKIIYNEERCALTSKTGDAEMKFKISRRAEKIQPSATLSVAALARELKASGRPVLSFSAGEPDFASPESAIRAARDAMERGETHYTANSGIPELKNAIASYYKTRFGLEYPPPEIIVSGGAKQVLYEAIHALVDDADEVVMPSPVWVSYVEQVQLAGGNAVMADTTDTNFIPTRERIEEALSSKTVGMIINSPNNPTGAVYGDATLEILADAARKNDLWIIYDEIYERLVYGGSKALEHTSDSPGHPRQRDNYKRSEQGVQHDRLADRLRARPQGDNFARGRRAEPHGEQPVVDSPVGFSRSD